MRIYDEDDTTVYMFYFKNNLYAWTTQKKDKQLFEDQRNIKVFRKKKVTFSPIKFHAFIQKYKEYQIIDIPVSSKGKDFSIYGTYFEDSVLSDSSERLLSEFEQIDLYFGNLFYNSHLPKKYENAVSMLLEYYNINKKTSTSEFNIDSLSIFYNLFKETF